MKLKNLFDFGYYLHPIHEDDLNDNEINIDGGILEVEDVGECVNIPNTNMQISSEGSLLFLPRYDG